MMEGYETLQVGDVIEIMDVGRDDLAKFIAKMGPHITGVEVGVASGEYSEILMKANPTMLLYGVDPYKPYKDYKDFVRKGTFNKMLEIAHLRLDPFPGYTFVRKTSMDAVGDFGEELDFVYIDGNHAEPYVSQDINEWSKKVRKGGIVSGHDYARVRGNDLEDSKNWAVIPAITKYAKENGVQLYVWGFNGKNGMKRDSSRSWMFFR